MSDQYVYFIQADENGPIKIGFTSDDPKRRLNQLQTGNASTLKLLGAIRGNSTRERQFHTELAEWRLQGEWFESNPKVLAAVESALSSPTTEPVAQTACLHCSFCFRCHHHLGEIILVAGTAANICEECIEWAAEGVAARKVAAA